MSESSELEVMAGEVSIDAPPLDQATPPVADLPDLPAPPPRMSGGVDVAWAVLDALTGPDGLI